MNANALIVNLSQVNLKKGVNSYLLFECDENLDHKLRIVRLERKDCIA